MWGWREHGSVIDKYEGKKVYLGRDYFDEFIQEAELPHLAVESFPTTLHARFQRLEEQWYRSQVTFPKTDLNAFKTQACRMTPGERHTQYESLFNTIADVTCASGASSVKKTISLAERD